MASLPAGAKVEKPSFAMIAAAGLKPPSAQPKPTRTDNSQKHDIPSSPQDGANLVSPSNSSNQPALTPKLKKIVALAPASAKETDIAEQNGPQVHVLNVDSASPPDKAPRALDGMLMPAASDEAGTQLSSSSGSVKPPSLDGKSVTSGTTFALDEKESLRPDDSASVKAREDEDVFAPPTLGLAESQAGSDTDIMAFRDQFREIPGVEQPIRSMHPPNFNQPPHGVLYIPPQGPGVGIVPGSARVLPPVDQGPGLAPDPKLLEALDSPKDRIMVLKLEQDIVDFVKDPKESSLKLPQTNAFYRMLAHRLADYYLLGHVLDDSTTSVRIWKTPQCRLPPPLTGIATPSTAASTPPPAGPQMKILRRGAETSGPTIANGSNVTSKTTSENGESGNDEDKKQKLPTSREEREARYEAARKRIMGSAKPSDSPEEFVEDISRSSSVADKKGGRKKQRADSDDDFEARSAYTAYYPAPQTPSGSTPTSYGYPPHVIEPQGNQYSQASYANHSGSYPQYAGQPSGGWTNPAFHTPYGASNWPPHQQPGYELSGDFQRAMSFQQPPMPNPNANMQPAFTTQHSHQIGAGPQPFQQQNSYPPNYPAQSVPTYGQTYPNHPPSAASQFQEAQPYAYGQLPSQTFPGRPPSKLEHPLPGSYKGKHFNPQSQAFIPAQPSAMGLTPMQSQAAPLNQVPPYGTAYGMATPPPRQGSAQSQPATFVSPQPSATAPVPARPSQPMTHPLPQPVFPRQPSPNVPLPPKPEATPPKPTDRSSAGPAIVNSLPPAPNHSSIAKWGTPASLPAKPPPSAEPFDASKFAPSPRQPSGSNRSVPNFGSMPSLVNGIGMPAQGMQSPRRS